MMYRDPTVSERGGHQTRLMVQGDQLVLNGRSKPLQWVQCEMIPRDCFQLVESMIPLHFQQFDLPI